MKITQAQLDDAVIAALNVRRKYMGHPPTTKKQFLNGLPIKHWEELIEQQTAALRAIGIEVKV